jgi:tripartite-type tricarboxylate transporter receptor subunit TctC
MIVSFPAGGGADVIGRIIAERLRVPLGQRVVIENVGGAGGSIGVGRAARARPDGYTVCLGITATHVLNGAFYSLPYDLLRDFAPISLLAKSPAVLAARKTMQAKDLRELIAWLKANPNRASASLNTVSFRLIAEYFERLTETQFTIVPYRAAGDVLADEVAGRIDLIFTSLAFQLPQLRATSVKAYAVTSDARSPAAPDIPTFTEMGLPALTYSEWYALFAPKGTPMDIIGKLNAAVVEALADQAVRSRLTELGYEIFLREQQTPEALAAMQKADAEKWWPIIKELGIKAE